MTRQGLTVVLDMTTAETVTFATTGRLTTITRSELAAVQPRIRRDGEVEVGGNWIDESDSNLMTQAMDNARILAAGAFAS